MDEIAKENISDIDLPWKDFFQPDVIIFGDDSARHTIGLGYVHIWVE